MLCMDNEKATEYIGFRTTETRKAWLDRHARQSHRSISEWLNGAIDAAMEGRVLAEEDDTTVVEARRWKLRVEALRTGLELVIRLLQAGMIKQPLDPEVLETVLGLDIDNLDLGFLEDDPDEPNNVGEPMSVAEPGPPEYGQGAKGDVGEED